MSTPLPKLVADYLHSPAGLAAVGPQALWFRWNTTTQQVESSGDVLRSTPEQMSRPRSQVFIRVGGGWKRYA